MDGLRVRHDGCPQILDCVFVWHRFRYVRRRDEICDDDWCVTYSTHVQFESLLKLV